MGRGRGWCISATHPSYPAVCSSDSNKAVQTRLSDLHYKRCTFSNLRAMAPISNSSSSGQGLTDSFWTFELPISRRGHFFQDSAFENAYEQLNNNVRRILQRWGETDFLSERSDDSKLRPSDTLNRFRELRRHNLKEEDQAVTVASDANTHKVSQHAV